MSDDRTPHWLVQLRFYLLCSPIGIIFAILLAPFAVPILFSFFGTLFLFWQGSRLFTNTVMKIFDPEGYERIKQNGGDPFYDEVGKPLNNDSEYVRRFGHEANVICPGCGQPLFIQNNSPFQCPNCNAYWNGAEWTTL